MSQWQEHLNLFSTPTLADRSLTWPFLGFEQYLQWCHRGAVNLQPALPAAEMTPSSLHKLALIRLFPMLWSTRRNSGRSAKKKKKNTQNCKCKWQYIFFF